MSGEVDATSATFPAPAAMPIVPVASGVGSGEPAEPPLASWTRKKLARRNRDCRQGGHVPGRAGRARGTGLDQPDSETGLEPTFRNSM